MQINQGKTTTVSTIYLSCEDHNEALKIDKIRYPEGIVDFNIAIVDSYLCNKSPWKIRLKRALKLLIGKEDVCYADLYVTKENFEKFLKQANNFLSEE